MHPESTDRHINMWTNESYHIWKSRVTHIWTSHITSEWVMTRVNTCYHICKSSHILSSASRVIMSHIRVMSNIKGHVTYEWVTSHLNESWHIWIHHDITHARHLTFSAVHPESTGGSPPDKNVVKLSAIVHHVNTKYKFSKVSTTVKRQRYCHIMEMMKTVWP